MFESLKRFCMTEVLTAYTTVCFDETLYCISICLCPDCSTLDTEGSNFIMPSLRHGKWWSAKSSETLKQLFLFRNFCRCKVDLVLQTVLQSWAYILVFQSYKNLFSLDVRLSDAIFIVRLQHNIPHIHLTLSMGINIQNCNSNNKHLCLKNA